MMTLTSILTVYRWAVRFLVGGLLIFAALAKLLDNRGFAAILINWRVIPPSMALGAGLFLSLIELAIGIWMWVPWRHPESALAGAMMHFFYAANAAVALSRHLNLGNCGCFGVYFPAGLGPSKVVEDSLIGLAVLTVYWLERNRMREELTAAFIRWNWVRVRRRFG
ncbi:MAG: hypothetical protein JO102_01115 [Elusimicrobia bacterium]|nr:hypothetical protein [Elusimicrobiota bacterium]